MKSWIKIETQWSRNIEGATALSKLVHSPFSVFYFPLFCVILKAVFEGRQSIRENVFLLNGKTEAKTRRMREKYGIYQCF